MPDHTTDQIANLIRRHVIEQLRSYQGNLEFARDLVQKDWLPAGDASEHRQHLESLQQHMAENGHPESDNFLLRLGLAVPGRQRGIVPPLIVLGENRGGFSTRRKREAEGQIRRLREALTIGGRFIPDLSSDTQQAIDELADFARLNRTSDVDWVQSYNDLSSEQADQLAERALEFLTNDAQSVSDIGKEVLQFLACFRGSPLRERHLHSLIDLGVFYPPNVFRDCGDAVAAKLVIRLGNTSEIENRNPLLLSLAWTRSSVAELSFHQWTRSPPNWSSQLHTQPADYSHDAGWCLDDDGHRRDLVSSRCFRLILAEKETSRSIPCRTRARNPCPACGGPQSYLFDFSKLSAQDFRELAEPPRRILCCLHCSCFGPTYAKYLGDGHTEWLAPFEPPGFEYSGDCEPCIRHLDTVPFPPFACAASHDLDDATTLGGIPNWRQDPEYPRCLECGQVMTFLAQHDNGILRDEGVYYAFFCARCHVTAVTYQQT